MGRYHPKRLLVAAIVLCLLYLHVRHSRNDEFYSKTVKALEKKEKDKVWKGQVDAQVEKILQQQQQQDPAMVPIADSTVLEASAGKMLSAVPVDGWDSGADTDNDNNNQLPGRQRPLVKGPKYMTVTKDGDSQAQSGQDSLQAKSPPYLSRVRATLDEIIHLPSIVIFSKSYCPYSRRAKNLLLETYDIVPKPHVVELDFMTEPADGSTTNPDARPEQGSDIKAAAAVIETTVTMGEALQDLLAERTGQRTVPNIMVLGKSIGGSAEVAQLDEGDQLAATLKDMVGKRLERCERKEKKTMKKDEA